MKKIFTYIISFFCAINCYTQLGPNDETIEIKTDFKITDFDPYYYKGNNINTPIASFKGNTYFIYIDSLRRPILGKIDKEGKTTKSRLDKDNSNPYYVHKDGHNKFSIGIDKNGYIHIVGDYHNYGAQLTQKYVKRFTDINYKIGTEIRNNGNYNLYWISKESESINSFEFLGSNLEKKIPGNGFSYPSFHSDMNGELYIKHRARVAGAGHYDGEMGWVVAKYDIGKKKWLELGDYSSEHTFPHNYKTLYKSIFWEDNGASKGSQKNWYQGFSGSMYFDFNNRLHVTTSINNDNNKDTMTDVLYAYSDDGGDHFHRADDSVIKLPISAESGSNQGSIVSGQSESSEGYHIWSSVCTNKEGTPIINYTKFENASKNKYKIGNCKHWDKKNNIWSKEKRYPSSGYHDQATILDVNGIISYLDAGKEGLITRDYELNSYDTSVYKHNCAKLEGFFFGIDQRGIREDNIIRGFHYDPDQKVKTLKIITLKGTPKSLTPISKEWTTNFIGVPTGENGTYNDIYQIKSTGIFDEKISGQFINQTIEGDFELQARVINVDYTTDSSFAGLLIKENNNESSALFGVSITSYEGIKTISKSSKSQAKITVTKGFEPSEWLKIKRIGNILTSYRSDNGQNWTKLESREVKMNQSVKYGLIAGSGNLKTIGHARIDHISLKKLNTK